MDRFSSKLKGHRFMSWRSVLRGPSALAFLPAICLGAFWIGGEGALLAVAALLPLVYLTTGGFSDTAPAPHLAADVITGVMDREIFDEFVDQAYSDTKGSSRESAVVQVEVEDYKALVERHGQSAVDHIMQRCGDRIIDVLRDSDCVSRIGDARFAILLAPVRQLDLELCIQLSGRLQSSLEEPISLDGLAVYVSASVGFCQVSRAPGSTAKDWCQAAATALNAARKRGPSAIRAFSDQMRRESESQAALREEVAQALDSGQIKPWFQPQISTDTGQITGFEALARWHHPMRGMISPADFLPAVEQAGLLERLAEVMMYHSFAALKAWDGAGIDVPQVGVNFAGSELSNPRLLERIAWELDRFDLAPNRLAVEVLETVVASAPDDMITRNINGLGEMGCQIDLDDFGTGHASLAAIRRFSVSRIKIDRSFVMKADRDPEQQRMISAILTMAERLGIETLAEGVESVGEHVLLAQLGCDHVQGFGIARPMPFEQTLDWVTTHNAKLQDVPRIMSGKKK